MFAQVQSALNAGAPPGCIVNGEATREAEQCRILATRQLSVHAIEMRLQQ